MDDRSSEAAFEVRLRALLAAELHRAELDYAQLRLDLTDGRRSPRSLVLATLVAVLIAAAVLIRPWAGPPATNTGGIPGPSPSAPAASPTAEACETALAEGTLVADGGTLALRAATGEIEAIAWPSGYSIRGEGAGLVLVDPAGSIKARMGDFVRVGGGVGNDGVFHGCGEVTSVPRSGIESPGPGSIIDGFKLGVIEACSPPIGSLDPSLAASSCARQPALALAALDARDPGHAAVVSTVMWSDGTQPEPVDVSGNAPTPTPPPTAHPGPRVTVFVFTLADGSVRATGVACPDPGSCVGVGSYPH